MVDADQDQPHSDHHSLKNRQAFTPAVRVAADGTIGVTYYDFRNNTTDPATLPTDLFLVHSHDQGLTWKSETRVTPTSFDMRRAPVGGLVRRRLRGLATIGNSFRPFFVQAGAACTRIDASNVFECDSNVFSTTVGPDALTGSDTPPRWVAEDDLSTSGRTSARS